MRLLWQSCLARSLGLWRRRIPCRPLRCKPLLTSPTGPTATVEEVLEKGLRLAEASPVHLAVRGTGVSSSTRCDWRGIARTLAQREAAIRFWLGLAATDTVPSASFLEILFTVTLDTLNPEYKETAKSNFLAIARGGLSTEYLFLTCYVDFTASEYLLGAGPTTVTLAYDRMGEAHSYELYTARARRRTVRQRRIAEPGSLSSQARSDCVGCRGRSERLMDGQD